MDTTELLSAQSEDGLTAESVMETARLVFRVWHRGFQNYADELWGNHEVMALIGGPFNADKVIARLSSEMAMYDQHGVQYWPMFDKQTDTFIGCCGLRPKDLSIEQYEIGFHLLPKAWGQGYAYEAAQRVCLYAFRTLQASSLFAGHNPANASSKRLLEKLGFQFTHTEFYPPTGLQHPSYTLTKEDFEERLRRSGTADNP